MLLGRLGRLEAKRVNTSPPRVVGKLGGPEGIKAVTCGVAKLRAEFFRSILEFLKRVRPSAPPTPAGGMQRRAVRRFSTVQGERKLP